MISPAFEAPYAADSGPARSPASDDTLTADPRDRTRCGSAALQRRKAPVRLVSTTVAQRSGVWSATAPEAPVPALQTSTSRPPNRSTAASTAARAEVASEVS